MQKPKYGQTYSYNMQKPKYGQTYSYKLLNGKIAQDIWRERIIDKQRFRQGLICN